MANNKKTTKKSAKVNARVKQLESKLIKLAVSKKPKQKKATPFRDVGQIAGRAIGGMFGSSSLGGGIGKWLGSGIGSIFGSGDYSQSGMSPKYNVLTNGSQIPQFSTSRQTNIVCHREYLGDIIGTAGFNNTLYPLNPGMAQTFPWLSSVAGNYQEYKFHGLVFEFRSLITDFVTSGAPGVVVMSTNYNADVTAYTTKQQMENAEYAVSVKPTVNMMHGVECAVDQTILSEKYVRQAAVPTNQDLRLYDLGNFQFATQANPIQDLGELWVSYCVEFFKPIQPQEVGGNVLSGHVYRTGVITASPLGSVTGLISGQLALTVTTTSVSFFAQPQQLYMLSAYWSSPSSYVTGVPGLSYVGLAPVNRFTNDSISLAFAPPVGTTAATFEETQVHVCTLLNPGIVTITFGATVPFPLGTTLDVIITELDSSVIV